MKRVDLVSLCKKRDISCQGNKKDLIERLIERDNNPIPKIKISIFVKFVRKTKSFFKYFKSPKYKHIVKVVKSFEVKNAVNTSNHKSKTSWIREWETYTKQTKDLCCINGCKNTANVGGHMVYKYNKRRHYIVPICYYHNSSRVTNRYRFLKDGTYVLGITKRKYLP